MVIAGASLDSQGISVGGDGRVLLSPDLARVTLGVEMRDQSLEVALREAATRLEAVTAQLKQSGVDAKDIRTVRFDVQPIHRFDEPTRRTVSEGFQVTNLVQVTFRDISALGARLDRLVAAGATTIQGIVFDVANPAAAVQQARAAALADAKARADHLAQLAGVRLGAPISITESSGPVVPQVVRSVPEAMPAAGSTPIEPGQSEVRVSVQIRYAIA